MGCQQPEITDFSVSSASGGWKSCFGTFLSKRLDVSPGSFDPGKLVEVIAPAILRFLH